MIFVRHTFCDKFEIDVPQDVGSYSFVRTMGTGSYSLLALVRSSDTSELYVCKVVPRASLHDPLMLELFEREVRIMESIQHDNIVQLIDVIYGTDLIFLIMEYCSGGDLLDVLDVSGPLADTDSRRILTDLVLGLEYLHDHNICHRDVKPENILFDAAGHAKLADFGLSQHFREDHLLGTPCGSIDYCAPEILGRKVYDGRMADIWSLGIVLCAMTTGRLPWASHRDTVIYSQAVNGRFEIPGDLKAPLRSLISRMLEVDPAQRITIPEILADPWVAAMKTTKLGRLKKEKMKAAASMGMVAGLMARGGGKPKVIVRPQVRAGPSAEEKHGAFLPQGLLAGHHPLRFGIFDVNR
jgi:serine/threonine protein kinase